MSAENMEWVRRAHEHFGRTGEPFLEGIDPKVEVYDHDIPDASNPYRGFEGIGKWLADTCRYSPVVRAGSVFTAGRIEAN